MSEYRYLPYSLNPRNKQAISGRKYSWDSDLMLPEEKALLYLNFLKCYTKRNDDTPSFEDVSVRGCYYNPYVTAVEARKMAKYFRDAIKRKTVYGIDKPFVFKGRFERVSSPVTLAITKRPYKEERLFLEALSGNNIRQISGSHKHFLYKLARFFEGCQGYWE